MEKHRRFVRLALKFLSSHGYINFGLARGAPGCPVDARMHCRSPAHTEAPLASCAGVQARPAAARAPDPRDGHCDRCRARRSRLRQATPGTRPFLRPLCNRTFSEIVCVLWWRPLLSRIGELHRSCATSRWAQASGHRVVVLEARMRPGGRVCSAKLEVRRLLDGQTSLAALGGYAQRRACVHFTLAHVGG